MNARASAKWVSAFRLPISAKMVLRVSSSWKLAPSGRTGARSVR